VTARTDKYKCFYRAQKLILWQPINDERFISTHRGIVENNTFLTELIIILENGFYEKTSHVQAKQLFYNDKKRSSELNLMSLNPHLKSLYVSDPNIQFSITFNFKSIRFASLISCYL